MAKGTGELVFVGLGLWSEKDITLAGAEAARACDRVFAEFYTSMLGVPKEKIEGIIGRNIEVLSREEVEDGENILNEAMDKRVCLLTGGDPMTATTHIDLRLRAIERGIATRIVHGISIITAASGLLGLQSYKFGRATTLAFPEGDYFPTSPYTIVKENMEMGLHTLVLLDVGNKFMTANEGIELLLKMEEMERKGIIGKKTLMAVIARASSPSPVVRAGYPGELLDIDFGPPLHCMVVPGKLHFMEAKALVMLANAPREIME